MASQRQRMPAATQTASTPSGTAWATIGSSQLATTVTPSLAVERGAPTHGVAAHLGHPVDLVGRDRFRRTTTRKATSSITAGSHRSSISATRLVPCGCGSRSADTTPLGRLAPWVLVTTGPIVARAVEIRRGGGLAVGAADRHGTDPDRGARQDVGAHQRGDLAADDRAVAPPEALRGPLRGAPERAGQPQAVVVRWSGEPGAGGREPGAGAGRPGGAGGGCAISTGTLRPW